MRHLPVPGFDDSRRRVPENDFEVVDVMADMALVIHGLITFILILGGQGSNNMFIE